VGRCGITAIIAIVIIQRKTRQGPRAEDIRRKGNVEESGVGEKKRCPNGWDIGKRCALLGVKCLFVTGEAKIKKSESAKRFLNGWIKRAKGITASLKFNEEGKEWSIPENCWRAFTRSKKNVN